MLDLKKIRMEPDRIKELITRKGFPAEEIDRLLMLDEKWREGLYEVEQLKQYRNQVSEDIAAKKSRGEDATETIKQMKDTSAKIKELDESVRDLDNQIKDLLLYIPNTPNSDVIIGDSEEDNKEIRRWGQPREFDFPVKAHWEIGSDFDILDFERAAKISGSRFTVFKNQGAKLTRALISFMIDVHTEEHGYIEVLPPYLVNSRSMYGTGNLPKFGEDAFHLKEHDLWLVPTAEVPVTNFYRDEILSTEQMPIKHVAYTACFRSEAGSAGRDTRGLIRQHQFDKVELVKFVKPEDSYAELEKLTDDAERILQLLELPYRVVEISTGDLGFTAAKKYDLEVWLPSYNRYVEISSCSNFEDYQARRANIRYRPEAGAKLDFVHTLNGSGLAVGRTVAALLENYQQADGTIQLPEILKPYMGNLSID